MLYKYRGFYLFQSYWYFVRFENSTVDKNTVKQYLLAKAWKDSLLIIFDLLFFIIGFHFWYRIISTSSPGVASSKSFQC